MTPRERILTTIRHEEPDRVPFDLGSTTVTGVHKLAYEGLRRELGLPKRPLTIQHMMQQLALVDDDVHAAMATDARGVRPRAPEPWRLQTYQRNGYSHYVDEWGIERRSPEVGGLYYDLIGSPLADARSVRDVERYPWPSPDHASRFVDMRAQAEAARRAGFAVVLGGISAGMMEMGLGLRGFERFLEDLADGSPIAEAICDRIAALKSAYWTSALAQLGDVVDIVQEGDDIGGQTGPLISRRTFERVFRPRMARLFDLIHRSAPHVAILFHSCGGIRPYLPDLVEAGVDIINPVQVSAAGMCTSELKAEYGAALTFWGGGIDTQHVLPNAGPDEVREEVRRRMADLAPGGGFVFSAVHNIQADVPPANVIAMREAVEEYGAY